jgi:hypothetical protein
MPESPKKDVREVLDRGCAHGCIGVLEHRLASRLN